MSDCCVVCNHQFKEDEGIYNYPDGARCIKCGDNYTGWKKKLKEHYKDEPKIDINKEFDENMKLGASTIGSFIIPNKLLYEYVEKVDYLRRAVTLSIGRDDPRIMQKALQRREEIHRQIFKHIRLPYHADFEADEKSHEFNTALDEIVTKMIENGYDFSGITEYSKGEGKLQS